MTTNPDWAVHLFDVIVIWDPEEGGYAVGCPALPGCWSQGETEAEALENIRDAIDEWLAAQVEDHHD